MTRVEAMLEMLDGYLDGLKPDSPEASGNRSQSYRHGFSNGRDDWRRFPRAPAGVLRDQGEAAIAADMEASP